jgi:hypothetical protein
MFSFPNIVEMQQNHLTKVLTRACHVLYSFPDFLESNAKSQVAIDPVYGVQGPTAKQIKEVGEK